MLLVPDHPGIGQKELYERLQLAPPTVVRFIDALAYKGYLTRQSEGKASRVFATVKWEALRRPNEDTWKNLHQRYAAVLGREEGGRPKA
jgi:DNA-binding MarR family transcriptional regulator